jgi:hypothetical protein
MWQRLPKIRLVIVIILLAGAFHNASLASKSEYNFKAVFSAVLCLVSVCIILGVTLRRQATKPLTDLVDLIYFGSGAQEDVPPLNLRLPRACRAERCYEKAVLECERLMEWHSLAPELWAELILAKRCGGLGGGQEEEITRNRALECLGMIHRPSLFDRMLRDRNDLPDFPAGLASQFER